MKIIVLIVATWLISGCSTTRTNLNIDNKRIGVDYRLNGDRDLCHNYIGVTVFNNEQKKYPVKKNLSKIISECYVKGIRETGNTPVVITSSIDWTNYMIESSWDGSIKLNAQGKEKIRNVSKERNLDYVLIAKDGIPKLESRGCPGSSITTRLSFIEGFTPAYVASIFDGVTGELVGDTFMTNDNFKEAYRNLSSTTELNKEDVERLVNYSSIAAYKAIKQTLAGNKE